MNSWPMWLWWVLAALLGATGVILAWCALFRDRARGRKRCPKCWYDMSGAVNREGVWLCPECGLNVKRERRLGRTRRRWRLALVGLVLVCLGPGGAVRQRVLREGWLSFVPTWALLQAARTPWLQDNHRVINELTYKRIRDTPAGGPYVSSIADLMLDRLKTSTDERIRRWAVVGLSWIGGRDTRVTPALLAALDSPEPSIRVQVIRSFRIYRGDPDRVLDRLIEIARDPAEPTEVRSEALDVLAAYRDRAATAAPVAIAALSDPDVTVRAAGAWALASLGPARRDATPILVRGLGAPPAQEDYSPEVSLWRGTAEALGTADNLPATLAPRLGSMLNQTSIDSFRQSLLWIVCRMGPDAAGIRPLVQQIANDPKEQPQTTVLAQISLARMDDPTLDPLLALARIVRTPQSVQRLEAAWLLWRSRCPLGPALPLLLDELDDGMDPAVLRNACHAIEWHAHPTDEVLHALERLLERWPDDTVAFTLGQMRRREWRGPDSK